MNSYQRSLEGANDQKVTITQPLYSNLPSNIYINIQIRGGTSSSFGIYQPHLPMRFSSSFNDSFIEDMQHYYVSIVTLTVSTHSLPLFIFDDIDLTQTNPNQTEWVLSFVYNNNIYQDYVPYIPSTSQPAPTPLSFNTTYYYGYNYLSIVRMLNQCLITIYQTMFAANSVALGTLGLTNTDYPYFIWNNQKKTFSLIYNKLFVGSGIQFFQNDSMNVKLNGFDTNFNGVRGDSLDYEFVFETMTETDYDATNNQNEQQYSCVQNFQTINQLVVISNSLKCRSEFILSENNSLLNSSSVLFSLNPLLESEQSQKSTLVYTSNGAYRLVDVLSRGNQRQLDMAVYYTTSDGTFSPVYLAKNEVCTLKLGFFKRSMFNNQY